MNLKVKIERPTASILDIATYLPANILSNEYLSSIYPDWSASKILDKTGIKERHIADLNETAGDMAYQASLNLFSQGAVSASEIDFIILCTQAPDYILPTTACILQNKLGISKSAGAIDINLGCSGYVYGLSLAKGVIETGSAKCVLLLTADTYSKYIHPMDKSVRTLFGDAATATVVTSTELERPSIGPFVFGTDGSGAENLIVKAGMFRTPKSDLTAIEKQDNSGNTRTQENLYMNGAEVMSFSLNEVPIAVNKLLQKSNETLDNIDYLVLHQANKFMLNALRKKLKITENKLPMHFEHCGNTVSSSIPIALQNLKKQRKNNIHNKIMLVGFGVGYSWAACLINF